MLGERRQRIGIIGDDEPVYGFEPAAECVGDTVFVRPGMQAGNVAAETHRERDRLRLQARQDGLAADRMTPPRKQNHRSHR